MRAKFVFSLLVAVFGLGLFASDPAHAIGGWFDHDRDRVPRAERTNRVVEHWAHRPRTRYPYKLHSAEDPYAYRYERRGYYPYYGAGYWRPRHTQVGRYRFDVDRPPYGPSWGYGPRRCWRVADRAGHHRIGHRRSYTRTRCARR